MTRSGQRIEDSKTSRSNLHHLGNLMKLWTDVLLMIAIMLSVVIATSVVLKCLFLVGAFLVKRARLLQWLVFLFFRQTTDLIVYLPLFTETTKTTQAKSGQCKLSAKGPLLSFFTFLTYKTGRD